MNDKDQCLKFTHRDLDSVLAEQFALWPVAGAGGAHWGADWEGAQGAADQGGLTGGQAARAHRS